MQSLIDELQSASDQWIENLKNEYKKALNKLQDLKEGYQKMKEEYVFLIEKRGEAFNTELNNLSKKISSIKTEYEKYSEKLKQIEFQFRPYLEHP